MYYKKQIMYVNETVKESPTVEALQYIDCIVKQIAHVPEADSLKLCFTVQST